MKSNSWVGDEGSGRHTTRHSLDLIFEIDLGTEEYHVIIVGDEGIWSWEVIKLPRDYWECFTNICHTRAI